MKKIFKSATDFRKSLEMRLLVQSQEQNVDLQRLRRKVAFDRFLARLFSDKETTWLLKGGYLLEIQFAHARSTKDIDLSFTTTLGIKNYESDILLGQLKNFATKDLGDCFSYKISSPSRELDGAVEGGFRFPVEAMIDGRIFIRFHLDVGLGDYLHKPEKEIKGEDWLEFAGIIPPTIRAISKEQQFAEKLHAYTLPRLDRMNTRVKDFIDMILLIQGGEIDLACLLENLHQVFQIRNTHECPLHFPKPPEEWEQKYKLLSHECVIKESFSEAIEVVANWYKNVANNLRATHENTKTL